jgi:hypothetical protein
MPKRRSFARGRRCAWRRRREARLWRAPASEGLPLLVGLLTPLALLIGWVIVERGHAGTVALYFLGALALTVVMVFVAVGLARCFERTDPPPRPRHRINEHGEIVRGGAREP